MQIRVIAALAVCFFSATSYSYAQFGPGGGTEQDAGPAGMGAEQMQEMQAMHGKMMNAMMIRPVGVSGAGEVFVLSGTKLQKYDSELNLVKEQEVKAEVYKVSGQS